MSSGENRAKVEKRMKRVLFNALKVVSGEKEGGLRVGSIDRYWLGAVVLEV